MGNCNANPEEQKDTGKSRAEPTLMKSAPASRTVPVHICFPEEELQEALPLQYICLDFKAYLYQRMLERPGAMRCSVAPPCAMRLLFGNDEIGDDEILEDCGIEEDAMLHVVLLDGVSVNLQVEGTLTPCTIWPGETISKMIQRVVWPDVVARVTHCYKKGKAQELEEEEMLITRQRPWWCPEAVDVGSEPIDIFYEVKAEAQDSECIAAFSHNRTTWGNGACDALSWYVAPHRSDFNFRTQMFGGFPRIAREENFRISGGEWHKVHTQISEDGATYTVDGRHFATARLAAGEVPRSGHLGFTPYASNFSVRNVMVLAADGNQAWPPGIQASSGSLVCDLQLAEGDTLVVRLAD